jgi:LuxR family maltose regulon positive regulatory protein
VAPTTREHRAARRARRPGPGGSPVLTSKITVPGVPPWAVRRPRIERLIARGTQGPLTSVTGPPGAGKTMAITLWAAACAGTGPLAWITFDHYDNQPKIFWSYVLAALHRAGITVPPLPAITGRGGAVDHSFLRQLAAVLAAQDRPVTLVLDDLHLVTDPAVLDGLAYVLRNAQPRLHLLTSSRMDPLLPLHRYRVAGELAEVRAADLAFTAGEAAQLMAQHDLRLAPAVLERLTRHAEGWAAGIRLAALSLDGHPDPEQFIKELDSEDSAVTGYLVDEVLNAQSPATRKLLLRTSILDRVSADIAEELTDDHQAAALLPALAQTNAFIQPVGHGWYRYHSLFCSALRLKLRHESPGRAADLHRRAAQWFRRKGWLSEAVRHAGDSGDWQLAARMVLDELAIGRLLGPQASESLTEAFQRMPPGAALAQPQPLLVSAAMELSGAGDQPGGASLGAAETLLGHLPAGAEAPARLAAALIRLALSRRTGDHAAAAAAASRAEALLTAIPDATLARHPGIRGQVLGGRAALQLWAGQLDAAAATLEAAIRTLGTWFPEAAPERADCLGHLALVEALRGRPGQAADLARQAARGDGQEVPVVAGAAASVALAHVHLARGELTHARNQLKLASAALRARPDKLIYATACLVAAYGGLAEGRPRVTAEMADRARQGWSVPPWLDHQLAIVESRACTEAGDAESAVERASRAGPENRLDAAAALAHAWLAAGDARTARQTLAAASTEAAPAPDQVRLAGWLADARLSYASGDRVRGRRSLGHALRLGRAERLRLPFMVERGWLRLVLRRDPELAQEYRDLLEPGLLSSGWAAGQGGADTGPLIVEQLSDREREVLQHLSQMMSTAEIAAEMYISVNTVKTHLKSIYRKLSAAHRNEAVRRARQLELL